MKPAIVILVVILIILILGGVAILGGALTGRGLAKLGPTVTLPTPTPLATPSPGITNTNQNIYQMLSSNGDFTIFSGAIKTAGLDSELQSGSNFTVFAPTDEAIKNTPDINFNNLMNDKTSLDILVRTYIVPTTIEPGALTDGTTLNSSSGTQLRITVVNGKINVNGAQIVEPALNANNGIVYPINGVITPQ